VFVFVKDMDEWIGVDQMTDEINYELYEEIKQFLHSYFCDPITPEEEEKWCSSIENALTRGNYPSSGSKQGHLLTEIDYEEIRAIPGGRYGCAQFVKICGPSCLT